MYTIYILTLSSLKMFMRNRQALFFSLFMPLMILFIFGSINFDQPEKMKVGLVTHTPSAATAGVVRRIRGVDALIVSQGALESERAELQKGNRTAVLDIPDDLLSPTRFLPGMTSGPAPQVTVYLNAGKPMEAQMVMTVLNQIADKASLAAARAPALFTVAQNVEQARNKRYIEFLLPGVIAMAVMQMSVFSVAFVFARYRETGVLKRLSATPMKPHQFVAANILTRLFMSVSQAVIFLAFGWLIYRVPIQGPVWLLAVCIVLGALMFLGLGFTISGLAKTMDAVPVYSNLIVFPMLFAGNVFFSIAGMPPWLRAVANYLPLTFFSSALRAVMTDGAGPGAISRELLGMVGWSVLLVTLATLTFRIQEKESV